MPTGSEVRRLLSLDRSAAARSLARAAREAALGGLLLTAVAGCDGDFRAALVGPVPSIDLALASGTLSMDQGDTATIAITLSRAGGYAGAVSLALSGAPAGVTGMFDPSPTSGGASTLTVVTAPTAATGTYQLTVTASGPGVNSRSETLALTITPPGQSPSIDLVLGAQALTVVQGQSGTVSVAVTRGGGYTGDVALALAGAPAGVTHAFVPATLAGSATSTLTLTAAATAAAGTYDLTITGTGTGVSDATATLRLTVAPAPPTPFITVLVRDSDQLLELVQGETDSWEVIVTRGNGYTGSVDLSIEGLPPGLTATFTPSTLAPDRVGSLMQLTAGSTASPGTTNITIRARGAGVADATVTLPLAILARGP